MEFQKMTDSILDTIKKMLGNVFDDFDQDIIVHINSALAVLRQLGIGPASGFRITGSSKTWNDFVPDSENLDEIKTYIYLKVKKVFDPPQNSTHLAALDASIAEYEWRLSVEKID